MIKPREYYIAEARRDGTSLISPEKKGDSLYAKCVYGFHNLPEKDKQKLRELDDYVFKTGARVGPALKFWETFKPFGNKVLDTGACVPMEMRCAEARGWEANHNHPNPKWHKFSLGSKNREFCDSNRVKKYDILFVDWDWGECYKDGILTLPSPEWLHGQQMVARGRGAHIVVVKSAREIVTRSLPYVIHVSRPEHKTAYMISVPGKLYTLRRIMDTFIQAGYDVKVLDKSTKACLETMKDRKPDDTVSDDLFDSRVEQGLRMAHKLRKDLSVESSKELLQEVIMQTHDWETSDEIIRAFHTSNFSEFVRLLEGSFETMMEALNTLQEDFNPAVAKLLRAFLKKCFQLKNSLLPKLESDFLDDAKKLSKTIIPQSYDVDVGGKKGVGFFYEGVFIIPYHVSSARPLHIGGAYYKAHTVDRISDLVTYGGPIPKFYEPERETKIFVKGLTADLAGRVFQTKPFQVVFPGAPVPGLSGSPMLTEEGAVVGVYSNHLLGAGVHITIPTSENWAGIVSKVLEDKQQINVYVPCSNGKTTILPKVVASKVPGKVMVVVPRTNLTDTTAKYMGPSVRGFSGEEKIEDSDAKIVLVTHGKFLSYLRGGDAFLDAYDVLMIDEAHDVTALTRMCMQWAKKHWTKKLIFMTGSPDDESFGRRASEHQRFNVVRTELKCYKPLNDNQILKILKDDPSSSYLVQVATKKRAKELIPKIPNSAIISRETVQAKGLDHFIKMLESGELRVAFITNVVNFGATLPVDKIIITGEVVEMETALNERVRPVKRFLSYSELLQYIGRVGRVRDGEAIMPQLQWGRPVLGQQEDLLLRAWEYLLDPDATDLFEAHGFEATRQQLEAAMELDGALSHNLGMVDQWGFAYAKDAKAEQYCEDKKIGWTKDKVVEVPYDSEKGPGTGFDPNAPLQTGFLSWSAILSSLFFAFKPTYVELVRPIDMLAERKPVQFRKGYKLSSLRFKTIDPGIKITALNEKVDDSVEVYFDSISTSWVSSLGWLSNALSFIYPVKCHGVEVVHSLFDAGKAEAVSYWLAGHGIRGRYNLYTGDDPLFKSFNTSPQLTHEEELLLCERFETPVIIATSRSWHLIPSLIGLLLGPLSLLIPAVYSVFRYNESTIRKWPKVSAFVRGFETNVSRDDYTQSGVAAVMAATTTYSFVQPILLLSFFSGMVWNLKIGSFVIPLSLRNKWADMFVSSGAVKYFMGMLVREHVGRWSSVFRASGSSRGMLSQVLGFLESANVYRPASVLGVTLTDVVTLVLTYLFCYLGWNYLRVKFWTMLYPVFFLVAQLWFIRFNPQWAFVPALGLIAFFSKLQIEDLRVMFRKGRFHPNTLRDDNIRVHGAKVFKRVQTTSMEELMREGDLDESKIKGVVESSSRWGTVDPFSRDWFASTDITLAPDVYVERVHDKGSIFLSVSTANLGRLARIKRFRKQRFNSVKLPSWWDFLKMKMFSNEEQSINQHAYLRSNGESYPEASIGQFRRFYDKVKKIIGGYMDKILLFWCNRGGSNELAERCVTEKRLSSVATSDFSVRDEIAKKIYGVLKFIWDILWGVLIWLQDIVRSPSEAKEGELQHDAPEPASEVCQTHYKEVLAKLSVAVEVICYAIQHVYERVVRIFGNLYDSLARFFARTPDHGPSDTVTEDPLKSVVTTRGSSMNIDLTKLRRWIEKNHKKAANYLKGATLVNMIRKQIKSRFAPKSRFLSGRRAGLCALVLIGIAILYRAYMQSKSRDLNEHSDADPMLEEGFNYKPLRAVSSLIKDALLVTQLSHIQTGHDKLDMYTVLKKLTDRLGSTIETCCFLLTYFFTLLSYLMGDLLVFLSSRIDSQTIGFWSSTAYFVIGFTSFSPAINVGFFPVESLTTMIIAHLLSLRFSLLYLTLLAMSRGIFDLGVTTMLLALVVDAQDFNKLSVVFGSVVAFHGSLALIPALTLHMIWYLWTAYSHEDPSARIVTSASGEDENLKPVPTHVDEALEQVEPVPIVDVEAKENASVVSDAVTEKVTNKTEDKIRKVFQESEAQVKHRVLEGKYSLDVNTADLEKLLSCRPLDNISDEERTKSTVLLGSKYRAVHKAMYEIVMNNDFRNSFINWITEDDFSNVMFVGRYGRFVDSVLWFPVMCFHTLGVQEGDLTLLIARRVSNQVLKTDYKFDKINERARTLRLWAATIQIVKLVESGVHPGAILEWLRNSRDAEYATVLENPTVVSTSRGWRGHFNKLGREPLKPVSLSVFSLFRRFVLKTKWIKYVASYLMALPVSYIVHPALFSLLLAQLLSTVGSWMIWVNRFSAGSLPEFDKSLTKLLSHSNLGEENLTSMTGNGPTVSIPKFDNSRVLVVGAAGSPRWLEKAIGLYYMYEKILGDIGFLIVTDEVLSIPAKAFAKGKSNVKVLVMSIKEPAQMRMARLAPLFWGDPKTYYLHRDADWMVTPLEVAACKLRRNIMVNPIGVSVSANMLASVNYYGSFAAHLRSKWWGSHSVWHHYGTDEQLCDDVPFDHVYNRLTPNEQVLFSMCARQVKFEKPRNLFVPVCYMHNSKVMSWEVDFRVATMSSFGDNKWRQLVHDLSSGSETFCSSRTPYKVVSTGYANWYFLAAASVQLILRDTVERYYLTSGIENATLARVQSSLKQLAFSMGSLMGVASGACGTLGAYHKGIYLSAVRSENGRNLNEYNNYDKKFKLGDLFHPDSSTDANASSIMWFCFLASPVMFVVGEIGKHFVPVGDVLSLHVALASISMGHPLSIVAGAVRMTATCIQPSKVHVWSDAIMLPLTVATARVGWFAWNPSPGIVEELEIPFLGAADSVVVKSIYPRRRERGWISGWYYKDAIHALPSGMLNLRTSTILAMSRFGLIEKVKLRTAVFGSGIGGIAQGLLHEGLAKELTLYTLDDPGFNTDPIIPRYAEEKGVPLQIVVGDFRSSTNTYERVFLDVAKPVDDTIWYMNDFEFREDQEQYEARCLEEAFRRVEIGGSLVVTVMNDMPYVPHEYLSFLSVHFSRITVVEDPLRRTHGYLWFVCEKKLDRRHPMLRSLLVGNFDWVDWDHAWDWYKFFEEGRASQYEAIEPVPSFWYPKLFSIFKPPLATQVEVVWNLDSRKYIRAGLSLDSIEFIEGGQIHWADTFTSSWATPNLIPSRRVTQHNTLVQVGRTVKPPVPDREFNAGVDLFSISILDVAQLLPLDFSVDVPSQSNFALLDGLKKRYDFPTVAFDSNVSWHVFESWADYLGANAKGYDFGVCSWDEIREHAYRKSTMGYMSVSPFKNVGEALDDEVYIEDYFQMFIHGGRANLGFHGSPKIEKKEISIAGEYLVPRIFMYKTGEVRLCEMRITKKLNDFLLDDKYNPHASCGDIFYRASKIVGMFESFSSPAAFEGESSKFDGHLEAELLVQLRRFFVRLVSYGENGSLLQNYIQSMTATDVLPNMYLASGDVVSFERGCMASGLWCTSCGDSAINEVPSFIAKMRALNVSFAEALSRFKTLTCGDDKIEVGEIQDVARVLEVRNKTYEEFGIVQTSENRMIVRPEDSSYCSHGYTRVTEDVCVPLRNLNELFARLVIPCANGQFRLDFPMASRSLSSVISLVATYWFVPEIVRFYEIVRAMIPKSVIPAAVAKHQRWKFEYNLGGLDPISFELESFLTTRFGRDPRPEVRLNPHACARLQLGKFKSIFSVSLAAATKKLIDISGALVDQYDLSIWYHEGFTMKEIFTDLKYFSAGKRIMCFFERSVDAREYFKLNPLPGVTVNFGSLRSVLGRAKTSILWLMFNASNKPMLTWLSERKPSHFRNGGFRGEVIKLASLEGETFTIHKTIKTGKSIPVLLLRLALGLSIVSLPALLVISTSTKVSKGNLIAFNYGSVLTSIGEVKKMIFPLTEPRVLEGDGVGKFLALENMNDRTRFFSLKRNDALKTVDVMVKLTRRFGMFVYDSSGNCHPYVVYVDGYEPKVGLQDWVDHEIIAKLNDRLGKGPVVSPKRWRTNGAMISVSNWEGEYHYGQIERPSPFYLSLSQRLFSVVLFVRISDCGILGRDGRHGNVYCFPDYRLDQVPKLAPIIGESSGPMLIDIPKPYDADLLGCHPTEVIDWPHKKLKAIFLGGSTGSGTKASNNVRVWLVENEQKLSELSGVSCEFRFTSLTNRIVRSIDGTLGLLMDGDYPVYPSKTMGQQSECKIIVIPEGHEAPDRILGVMMTGSLALIIRPTHVVTTDGWFKPLLKAGTNCLMCNPEVSSLVNCLKWVKENDDKAQVIAREGVALSATLSRESVMKNYMCSVVAMAQKSGDTRKTLKEFLNWQIETRAGHRLCLKDTDHHYYHGFATRVDSSAFHLPVMRVDVGCGCSLSKPVVFSPEMEYLVRTIKKGEDVFSSADHLTNEEYIMATCIADTAGVETRFVTTRLGTLGGGNHFVELVWNKGVTRWMVHSGSRGLSQDMVDKALERNLNGLKVAKSVNDRSLEMASLNRKVILRLLGAEEEKSWVHTKLTEYNGGVWFVQNLLSEQGLVPLLSSPGTGFVMVDNPYALCPHGMGKKGSRARPIKGADLECLYQTICRTCVVNTPRGFLEVASFLMVSLMRAFGIWRRE